MEGNDQQLGLKSAVSHNRFQASAKVEYRLGSSHKINRDYPI
jgi:hypothetical protein